MGVSSSKSKSQHAPHPLNAPKGYSYKRGQPMIGYGPGPMNYGQGFMPGYGQVPVIPFGQGAIGYGQGPGPNYPQGPSNYGRGVIPNNGPVIPQGFGNSYPQIQVPEAYVPRSGQPVQEPQGRESRRARDSQETRETREGRHSRERSTRRRKTRKRTMTGTIRIANNREGQTSTHTMNNNDTGVQPQAQAPSPDPPPPPRRGGTPHPALGNTHRAQTPFHHASSIEPSNSQNSQSQSSHMSLPQPGLQAHTATPSQHQAPPVIPSQAPPVIPSQTHIRRASTQRTAGGTNATHPAVSPAHTSPPSTAEPPRERVPNPLPEPPRDIYAMSPYKHLLAPKALPTTATHNQTAFIKREVITAPKPPKKGLFRAFSSKKSTPQTSKTVEYVYIPTSSNNSTASKPVSAMTAIHPQAPAPQPTPSNARPPHVPEPAIASGTSQDQPIYFDQDSEYSYYLIHSPHGVWYEDREYPTAAHLLEALKFLPDHPEIAERIRQSDDTEEVYRISAEYAKFESPNYAPAIVETMQKVISLKFKQHADLRYKLWNTDPAPLRYNDPSDSFWGIGPNGRGRNELGAVLERVRAEVKPRRR